MDLFHIGIYFCNFAGHGWFHQRLASRPFWRRRLLLLRRLCLRQFLRQMRLNYSKFIQNYWWLRSPVINWIGSDDWVDNAHYIYLDGNTIGGNTNINLSYGRRSPYTTGVSYAWFVTSSGVVAYDVVNASYGRTISPDTAWDGGACFVFSIGDVSNNYSVDVDNSYGI